MKFSSLLLVCFLVFTVSCASKKPKSDNAAANDASLNGKSLVLNGNSDSGTAGGLVSVYFDYQSAAISASGKEALKNNAEFLKKNKSVTVSIEGHCDERGGRQFNLALGEKRAKTVRDYLVALGIAKKRMSVISYGNERPVVEGHSEAEWSKNRRGNFNITSL
jgi:peptidoglycan-associated lipoprotein